MSGRETRSCGVLEIDRRRAAICEITTTLMTVRGDICSAIGTPQTNRSEPMIGADLMRSQWARTEAIAIVLKNPAAPPGGASGGVGRARDRRSSLGRRSARCGAALPARRPERLCFVLSNRPLGAPDEAVWRRGADHRSGTGDAAGVFAEDPGMLLDHRKMDDDEDQIGGDAGAQRSRCAVQPDPVDEVHP